MKNKKQRSGQALIEFALIIPLALLLLTAFLDIGRALYSYSSLSTAVREGTRFAITNTAALDAAYPNSTSGVIVNKVKEYTFGMKPANVYVTVYVTKDPNQANGLNQQVEISASYCLKAITPLVNKLFGNKCPSSQPGIVINANSTMSVAPIAR